MSKEILEEYLGVNFIKIRPDWLDRLELDGYNEELNIGFEYNGIQHYKYSPDFFHQKGIQQFHSQQKRDRKKYKLCDKLGVRLIIIPYEYDHKDRSKLDEFIFDELCKLDEL